jgi:hypothetical protein
MPRKTRPRQRRPDPLMRFIEFSEARARTGVRAARERGQEPEVRSSGALELVGTMDEPVRDTREIEVAVYADDAAKLGAGPPPWIGFIETVRPVVRAVVFVSHRDFDRLWMLALSGLLKHVRLAISRGAKALRTKPSGQSPVG